MRVLCSYCRETIREDRSARATDVSHGMCPPCAAHFERLWGGISLSEYLDDLPEPVLVVTDDVRVVAANAKLAALLGRDRAELTGLLGGEALACSHSRLPEGCGRTVHCRECTIRRAVTEVAETGRPLERVPAYLKTAGGRLDLRVSARAEGGLVKVVVEELRAPQPATAGA